MDLYREIILDHYKHPRNFGHLKNPHIVVEELNLSCGDKIIMEMQFVDAKTLISVSKNIDPKQVKLKMLSFSGEGCAVSQAAASMLTETVLTKNAAQILSMTSQDIIELLGIELTPTRLKCALLSLMVLHKGVLAYLEKINKSEESLQK